MFQTLDKPYDEKDYPAMENVTYESVADMFATNLTDLNSTCKIFGKNVADFAKINATSNVTALKSIISNLEKVLKEKLNDFAFRLRFPENPKDAKLLPSGCNVIVFYSFYPKFILFLSQSNLKTWRIEESFQLFLENRKVGFIGENKSFRRRNRDQT